MFHFLGQLGADTASAFQYSIHTSKVLHYNFIRKEMDVQIRFF